MTGLMLLADPPDREHLRLRWDFSDAGRHSSLWFWDRRGLGTVRLYTADALRELAESRTLGPDALAMTLAGWRSRLAATSRPVKVALLDQKLAAGIGNLYASEILHQARIHPAHPANRLTSSQIRRLSLAVKDVLTRAILHEGSTLSDGTYRNALSQAGRYQNEHRVYMKAGQPCATCRHGTIERVVQAQRSTFFCGRCQRQ
jgi:formamidopyrimidine-DNA glycosylase